MEMMMKQTHQDAVRDVCVQLDDVIKKVRSQCLEIADLIAVTEPTDRQLLGFYLTMKRAAISEKRLMQTQADLQDTMARVRTLEQEDPAV